MAAGVYLCSIAAVLIIVPKAVSTTRTMPYVFALKTISPYPTLAFGVLWFAIAWGLLRLRDWARFAASLFMGIGAVWAIPILVFKKHATWVIVVGSVEIVLRACAVWYLMSPAIIDAFNTKDRESLSTF